MKALIIGGGIGGLTTAIALQKTGIDAHVYERTSQIREVGAGISLWSNAIRVLDLLGLGEAIRSRALSNVAGRILTCRGELLSTVSTAGLERQFGTAIAVVHRADLVETLLGAIDADRVHLAHELTRFTHGPAGITAQFSNDEVVQGDLLVGADGLHSVVRSHMFNDGPPKYSGYTAWRAVANFTRLNLAPSESWGPGRRFGIVPMSDGRVYWFATQNAKEGQQDNPGQAKAYLRRLFSGWHDPIQAVLEATDESAILRNDIYDRDPIPQWSKNHVTLLGDAAHPTTPNLGQGGCQAIEDAVVLAVCLASASKVEDALCEYEARRIPRTKEIVLQSRRIGDIAQVENSFLRFLRNLAIRATPKSVSDRQLNSVVAYEVLTEAERQLFSSRT